MKAIDHNPLTIDLAAVHGMEGSFAVLGILEFDKSVTTTGADITITMKMINGKINIGQGSETPKDIYNISLGHLTGQSPDVQTDGF